jgi:hypothetical protein
VPSSTLVLLSVVQNAAYGLWYSTRNKRCTVLVVVPHACNNLPVGTSFYEASCSELLTIGGLNRSLAKMHYFLLASSDCDWTDS